MEIQLDFSTGNKLKTLGSLWQAVSLLENKDPVVIVIKNLFSTTAATALELMLASKDIFRITGQVPQIYTENNELAACLLSHPLSKHYELINQIVEANQNLLAHYTKVSHLRSSQELPQYLELINTDVFPIAYRNKVNLAITELCNNSFEHSNAVLDTGDCYIATQVDFNKGTLNGDKFGYLNILVHDFGIGIKNSLLRRYPDAKSDEDALLKVLSGVTSRSSGRGGMGLTYLQDLAQICEGYFYLLSGNALAFVLMRAPSIEKLSYKFPGTLSFLHIRFYHD